MSETGEEHGDHREYDHLLSCRLKEYPIELFVEVSDPPWIAYLRSEPEKNTDQMNNANRSGMVLDRFVERVRELEFQQSHEEIQSTIRELVTHLETNPEEPLRLELTTGRAPEPGRDGVLIWHNTSLRNRLPEEVLQDVGTWHNITEDLNNVAKGESISTLLPVKKGRPGLTVFGEKIPVREGESVKVKAGKNVEFHDGNQQFVAHESGHYVHDEEDDQIYVETVFHVDENLDLGQGFMVYFGTLRIEGDVESGRYLEARDDLYVSGRVFNTKIVSGRNVTIDGGIAGKGKASVEGNGALSASYLNNCRVRVEGDVEIKGEIVNSNVRTNGALDAPGSVVRGGRIVSKDGIRVSEIGSKINVATEVITGLTFQYKEEQSEISEELNDIQEEMNRYEAMVGDMEVNRERLKKLPENKLERVLNVLRKLKKLRNRKAKLEERKEELSLQMMDAGEATIKVRDLIYPGVTLQIGNIRQEVVDRVLGPVELSRDTETMSLSFRDMERWD